ncbi:hypothetical protein SteCoe_12059 [Stentor coeruleus]|uniref:GPS domain-containing protein n=1 Tax=Stentor coeruleus TaxID=5963 RepID=A0A1R2CBP5_9CILI|nr:hypothetical protein SteCoe_12059 [Stentor coeruleus]
MVIRLIFVFLLCKTNALLTFSDLYFGINELNEAFLNFTLVDEKNNIINTPKMLYVEINPAESFIFYPSVSFTGIYHGIFIPSKKGEYSLSLSCSGCELITEILYYPFSMTLFSIVTPKYSTAQQNQEVIIEYNCSMPAFFALDFTTALMVSGEIFELNYEFPAPSIGSISVSFFTSGEKRLMLYFSMDPFVTIIDGVIINVYKLTYNSIEFLNTYPVSIKTSLDFLFSAFEDEEMTIPSGLECEIHLSLTPDTFIIGNTAKKISSGIVLFSNLIINSNGVYKVNIKGVCIEPFVSENFITITGVDLINIILESIYIKKGKEIDIKVNFFGPSESNITFSTFVTILSSSIEIVGTKSAKSTTGEALLQVSFDTSGTTTLSAFTDIDLKTVISNSIDVYILDSICLEKVNDICIECVPLANIVDGTCICTKNSVNVDVYCKCIDGYAQSGNDCLRECFNAFSETSVLGSYNEGFKSISITFPTLVIESSEVNCGYRLFLPDYLNEFFIECIWVDLKVMLISFSTILDGDTFVIGLNNTLTPYEQQCNQYKSFLNIEILSSTISKPKIQLKGPSFVYLLCKKDNIIISNTQNNNNYEYQWIVNPYNPDINSSISSIKSYKIEIKFIYLQEGILEIICIAKDLTYNTYANETISITITSENHLVIGFSIPDDTSFLYSDTIFIQGYIEDSCGQNGQITFIWEYMSNNDFDLNSIIFNSSNPSSLLIPPNTFKTGSHHVFKLTAIIEPDFYEVSKTISLNIKSNDLIIQLDKSSGTITKTQDLIITAIIIDPDSSDSIISIEWVCFEENEYCKDKFGEILNITIENFKMVVNKDILRNGAYYTFNITAKTDNKIKSQIIRLYVDGLANGQISINCVEDYSIENIACSSVTIGITNPKFVWEIYPNISDISYTEYSFISIPKKKMTVNTVYNISLTALPSSGNTITAFIYFIQPKILICEIPTIEFLDTKWFIMVKLCDSESYPLTYQFGCKTSDNSILWLAPESFKGSDYVLIPSKCKKVVVENCNKASCSIVENKIPSGERKHEDMVKEFTSDLKFVSIPNAVIYYSNMITTQNDWDFIYLHMEGYFKSQKLTKKLLDLLNSCLSSIITQIKFISPGNATSIIKLINYVVLENQQTLNSTQISVISTLLGKLSNILDYKTLFQTISSTIDLYSQVTLPFSLPLSKNSDVFIFSIRILASSLTKQSISIGKNSIIIPNSIVLDMNAIYDIEFLIHPTASEVAFDVSFYTSGTYINNKLTLTKRKNTKLNADTISVTIIGTFSSKKHYECAYLLNDKTWETSGCSISKIADNKITISLSHQSTFKVYEKAPSKYCGISAGPIAITSAWLMVSMLLFFSLKSIDKNHKDDIKHPNKYVFYPIASIFIRQINSKRVSSILYMCSTNIIMIFGIGILFQIFESSNKTYGNFKISEIYYGAIAWVSTQIFAFPIYYFLFSKKVSNKAFLITKIIALGFSVCGAAGIMFMAIYYCCQYAFYWIVNYFIFFTLQLVLEICLAFLMWKFHNSQTEDSRKKIIPETQKLNISKVGLDDFSFEFKDQNIEKNQRIEVKLSLAK